MESKIGYLNNIGFVRVLACITILLYHMNILKGGYLSVCIFFVLSGYFACVSLFRKENFSFKDYYLNKLKNIYIPLIVVVFISIAVISLFDSINWFNLKPETTSVLLGYNNFWQLDANLDYFARHVSSPFMHLWYMGIILQFDLVFPFIFLILKKLGDKCHKLIPCIITGALSLIFTFVFYKSSLGDNLMVTYYSTFTRIFSILFGVFLAFIYQYYNNIFMFSFNNKNVNKAIYGVYLIIILLLFIFIGSTSKYFAISMILVSLITCRLIALSHINNKKLFKFKDRIIRFISSISYEVYLVQYPIIFIFQYINLNNVLEIFLIIFITFIVSLLIKFALSLKSTSFSKLRIILFLLILVPTIFGTYKYIISKDYTSEMKALESNLELNSQIMEERKKEYASKINEEKENWLNTLKDLEQGEEELKNVVSNLTLVGIGDSIMLGAIDELQSKFPNGYFDAAVSRTAYVANGIIRDLSYSGLLGDPVVINLGANGDCDNATKDLIMSNLGNRKVFWLNVTNDYSVGVNANLNSYASRFNNLYVIDWNSISSGHPEYFIADGIHLTYEGKKAYVKAIYDSIYKVYLDEYNEKKQSIMEEYEQKQNEKITFIGNSMLINAYNYLDEELLKYEFITDSEYDYDLLRKELKSKINNNELSNKIVFVLDKSAHLTLENYKELIKICSNHKIKVISVDNNLSSLTSEKVEVVDFIVEKNYYLADGIHLSKIGNQKLNELILNIVE